MTQNTMAADHQQRATADALAWLRETDTLTESAIIKAVTEDLRCEETTPGVVTVTNHEHDDPAAHQYEVFTSGELISSCDCPHFEYRSEICKHMISVAMWFDEHSQKTISD